MTLDEALNDIPLIAILRGVTPGSVIDAAGILIDAGFRSIEVPLNSPEPFESIERLTHAFAEKALIGAGTVIDPSDCDRLADAGGGLMVAPNFNPAVVMRAKKLGLVTLPGVATPSEAFAAIAAGADGLKMFPAEVLGRAALKAWRAVLPADIRLLPVGGIGPDDLEPYMAAGANGFGIGSALFKPGVTLVDLEARAIRFATAARMALQA